MLWSDDMSEEPKFGERGYRSPAAADVFVAGPVERVVRQLRAELPSEAFIALMEDILRIRHDEVVSFAPHSGDAELD